jgi:8-oxo-dGTP pyrophosphatase MutT (NUDIX family)
MELDIFDGGITKVDIVKEPHTIACRGVIEKDGKYLVVNASKFDITMFPGGRLEENETLEECCVREVLEETGIICKVISKKISINEYFIDSSWTNIYFHCEYVKDTKTTNFTEEEISIGLTIQWKTLEELLDTYENNMTLHEHGPNIHNREFLGLIHSI